MHSVIAPDEADLLLNYMFSVADLVEVQIRVRPALSDPDDDRVLEVAVRAGAPIVTFNMRDFVEAAAFRIPVFSPAAFLREIGDIA